MSLCFIIHIHALVSFTDLMHALLYCITESGNYRWTISGNHLLLINFPLFNPSRALIVSITLKDTGSPTNSDRCSGGHKPDVLSCANGCVVFTLAVNVTTSTP